MREGDKEVTYHNNNISWVGKGTATHNQEQKNSDKPVVVVCLHDGVVDVWVATRYRYFHPSNFLVKIDVKKMRELTLTATEAMRDAP